MNQYTTTITISPNKGACYVSLICLVGACIFKVVGIDAKYPRISLNIIIFILAAAIIINWTEYSFNEKGFCISRCGLLRRNISWDQIDRVVETIYEETTAAQNVLLIVLKSASKSKYFCKGDSVDAYIFSNLGNAYKVSFGGNYDTKRTLYAHIREYWGEIEQ